MDGFRCWLRAGSASRLLFPCLRFSSRPLPSLIYRGFGAGEGGGRAGTGQARGWRASTAGRSPSRRRSSASRRGETSQVHGGGAGVEVGGEASQAAGAGFAAAPHDPVRPPEIEYLVAMEPMACGEAQDLEEAASLLCPPGGRRDQPLTNRDLEPAQQLHAQGRPSCFAARQHYPSVCIASRRRGVAQCRPQRPSRTRRHLRRPPPAHRQRRRTSSCARSLSSSDPAF